MNYSQISDEIFIGTTPSRRDFDVLRDLGVRLVINMRFWQGQPPQLERPELRYMRVRTFDSPLMPIPIQSLRRGALAALEVISQGGKVYTHCARGRHRGVAMAAAIMIAQGLSPERAIALIKERRAEADPEAFHIRSRIVEFGRQWALAATERASANEQTPVW